jgi:hypothetical protein
LFRLIWDLMLATGALPVRGGMGQSSGGAANGRQRDGQR